MVNIEVVHDLLLININSVPAFLQQLDERYRTMLINLLHNFLKF